MFLRSLTGQRYFHGTTSVTIQNLLRGSPCGNISRAAKELYISQPAISKAISKLEESLGTRLFNRNSRGVQLTREGTILFQHVNTAFDSIGHGERELKRIHDFHIGNLKIGVSNTLCKYVLLPYLKGFIGKISTCKHRHREPVHLPDTRHARCQKDRYRTLSLSQKTEKDSTSSP